MPLLPIALRAPGTIVLRALGANTRRANALRALGTQARRSPDQPGDECPHEPIAKRRPGYALAALRANRTAHTPTRCTP